MAFRSIAIFVARALIALLFLLAGTAKMLGPGPFLAHMAEFHVPGYLLWVVVALEIGAGAALLLGWRLFWSAGALAVFCLLTAFIFHFDFAVPAERTLFFKDLAIAGGLISIAATAWGTRRAEADAADRAVGRRV
jgi:putative oxidoreductase